MAYRKEMTEGEARDELHDQIDVICYSWQQGTLSEFEARSKVHDAFDAWLNDQTANSPQ